MTIKFRIILYAFISQNRGFKTVFCLAYKLKESQPYICHGFDFHPVLFYTRF